MFMVGPIGFTAPLLLWGLVALPVLWLLLRAVPPAPIRRRAARQVEVRWRDAAFHVDDDFHAATPFPATLKASVDPRVIEILVPIR